MKTKPNAWTAREDAELERMRAAARTAREIAADLGRSIPAVTSRLNLLGIYVPNRLITRYLPHVTRPHTNKDVAAAVGCTEYCVRHAKWKLKKLGYPVLRGTMPPGHGRWSKPRPKRTKEV